MSDQRQKPDEGLGPWQFTLRRLMLASVLLGMSFAVIGWNYRIFASHIPAESKTAVLILSIPVICVLLGAASGAMLGKGAKWAGLVALAIVSLFLLFSLVVGLWALKGGVAWWL